MLYTNFQLDSLHFRIKVIFGQISLDYGVIGALYTAGIGGIQGYWGVPRYPGYRPADPR